MIVGVDEAGRGPVMGPLVVGAVAVDDTKFLESIGVRDSKTYTASARDRVFERIEANTYFSMVKFTAQEIDETRKKINLNQIELKCFARAIQEVYRKVSSRFSGFFNFLENSRIFLDSCDVNESRFGENVARELYALCNSGQGDGKNGLSDPAGFGNIPSELKVIINSIVSKHRADDIYPVVSAASIVAKTHRELEVKRIQDELSADIGSGYPSDVRTIKYLQEYFTLNGKFPPYTRHSWKSVENIRKKVLLTRQKSYF